MIMIDRGTITKFQNVKINPEDIFDAYKATYRKYMSF